MLIKHQLRSNFFIISGFHPLFDKEPKNYRHKSIAYINILILETTGSKILLKTLGFKSK